MTSRCTGSALTERARRSGSRNRTRERLTSRIHGRHGGIDSRSVRWRVPSARCGPCRLWTSEWSRSGCTIELATQRRVLARWAMDGLHTAHWRYGQRVRRSRFRPQDPSLRSARETGITPSGRLTERDSHSASGRTSRSSSAWTRRQASRSAILSRRSGKGLPAIIFGGSRPYDLTRDGTAFFTVAPASATQSSFSQTLEIQVVLNWFEELKRLVSSE